MEAPPEKSSRGFFTRDDVDEGEGPNPFNGLFAAFIDGFGFIATSSGRRMLLAERVFAFAFNFDGGMLIIL